MIVVPVIAAGVPPPIAPGLGSEEVDPPRDTDVPAIVIAELARLAFGNATIRAFGSVPLVMFVALVVSVVADGANDTLFVLVQVITPVEVIVQSCDSDTGA